MKKSLLLLALLTFGCSKKPVDMDEVLFDRADRWITNSKYSSFFFYNIKVYNGPAFTKHSNGEKKEKGEINASLISSKELSKQEIEKISKELSIDRGSSIKFSFEVDKSLIGGLIVKVGSLMIDTSVKTKLKQIENKMVEA